MAKKLITGVGLPAALAEELRGQYNPELFDFVSSPSAEDLLRNIASCRIDLLFIYSQLPDLKNYEELCIALRSSPELETVPVIVISQGAQDQQEKIRMLNSGLIDGFIHASTSPEELAAFASVFLQRRALEEELELKNQLLQTFSITDELTKLYNRRHLIQIIGQEMQKVIRYNYCFSSIMFDIDDYKKINDTFGHARGDAVLEKLAELIKRSIRSVDIACRYGGDEFVVVYPFTNLESAFCAAERLRRRAAEYNFHTGEQPLTVSLSMGLITVENDDRVDVDTLLRLLDQQLYQAKRSGKNKTCAALVKNAMQA